MVRYEGNIYKGIDGARILLERQAESIRKLKEKNIIVKINTVVVPDVNMDHVPAIAKQAEAWGVDLMNCIAMIQFTIRPLQTTEARLQKKSITCVNLLVTMCRK